MTAREPGAAAPGQAAYEAVESPNKPRPDDPLVRDIADALRRVENNYQREGSGPGSRFEGALLEDVQAARAVLMVRAADAQVAQNLAAAAAAPQAGDGLRADLEGLVNFWAVGGNGIDAGSQDLISACSAELLRVLDEHPDAEPVAAPGLRADAETAELLRADLADAEALLLKWPKCPAGCNCRIGIEDDPDRNECGCDGPCNAEPAPAAAPELAAAPGEGTGCNPQVGVEP